MLLNRVRAFIKKYRLLNKGDTVVVGLSGGPDSLALLLALNSLKKEYRLKLHAAHLDHMLRKDSRQDAIFVQKFCRKLNLPVTTAAINIKSIARRGSVEEIARNARLGFLLAVAKKSKAKKIALAHNLDDQAETILMRILRGTGLNGLSGILPMRKLGNCLIIRPLIEIKRPQIERFLKRKGVLPLRDPSNTQDVYFRNKLRNRLLPLLKKGYNLNIQEVLSNMAEGIAMDYDYLDSVARREADKLGTSINLDRYNRLHPAIQRMVLRRNISRLQGDTRRITSAHIKEIEDLISSRPANSIVDLPKGISVIKKKKILRFYMRKTAINS